ncbi:hypothetical protein D1AOALGA4SA_3214 [Olavius algarvensis Delta 1 endosymbiont]|nr:hypothetical protein D1AOALGA4SA_3214 [Olavius algarvensis Delta 1 endosymbiont]
MSGVRCQCSAPPLAASVQSHRERNFRGSTLKSIIVGFRILQKRRYNVGWVECNETQQRMKNIQPNLQYLGINCRIYNE